MARQLICVRAGCFHPATEHEGQAGACLHLAPNGELTCTCASVVLRRDTIATLDAPSSASDDATRAPQATPSDDDARTTRSANVATPQRRRMSTTRAGQTRVFRLSQTRVTKCTDCGREHSATEIVKLYFTANFHEDGTVGEVFIKADQQGATLSGALDAVSIMMSMLLQYGAPLGEVIAKLRGLRFPPDGFTRAGDIPNCTSPLDLLARWLETLTPKEKTDGET